MSSIVTFRVKRNLKERMDRLKYINWSKLLKDLIERIVEEEEKRMRRAAEEMDSLALFTNGSGWLGSKEVLK
ncbi:MAG: hypothetical protein ACUVTD_08875 [Nitrososphaerales archaeon]